MKHLLTFENKSENIFYKLEQLAKNLSNDRSKIQMPFTAEEYYQLHQKLDDVWGLEASMPEDDEESNTQGKSYFKFQNSYEAFREVASDFDKLQSIKAVADLLGKSKINFCDMGCGLGQIVYFCQKMGMNSIGVEYQEKLREAHEWIGVKVIYGDFFRLDLGFLKKQDIIYLYRPIDNLEGVNKLLRLIAQNIKPGAVLIASMLDDRANSGPLKKIKIRSNGGFSDCFLVR